MTLTSPLGRIVVIGFGNMGRALVRGLLASRNCEIIVCDRYKSSEAEDFLKAHSSRIKFLQLSQVQRDGTEIPLGSNDTLILCTKPQNLQDTVQFWKPVFCSGGGTPLVVSILAGTPIEQIQKLFHGSVVARAMPNIAATVDSAATALCISVDAGESEIQRAKSIFEAVGKAWIVPEELMNAVTGLSGSGPAYIYMVIEALSDGGVKMGMPRQLALELAAQTVLGAAKLVQETGLHPAVLRDQVTTPGGTTISAIHELERHGLRPMLISAVVTATKKSRLLARAAEKKVSKN
jgi:pyrroline-5-carboxylate reductase